MGASPKKLRKFFQSLGLDWNYPRNLLTCAFPQASFWKLRVKGYRMDSKRGTRLSEGESRVELTLRNTVFRAISS